MARPKQNRRVRVLPPCRLFEPRGLASHSLGSVTLSVDELEALRLIDLQEMSQARAAAEMGVSRATIGRVIAGARRSVAGALVQGRRIVIEGGAITMPDPKERSGKMKVALAIDRRGGLARHLRRSEEFRVFEIDKSGASALEQERRPNPRRDDPGSGGRGERQHLHARGQGLGPNHGGGCGAGHGSGRGLGHGHGGGHGRGMGRGRGGGGGCGHEEHHRHGHGGSVQGPGSAVAPGATALATDECDHGVRGRWLVDLLRDCEAVIARGMGTRLQTALRAAGIRPILLEQKISPEEALELYRQGRL